MLKKTDRAMFASMILAASALCAVTLAAPARGPGAPGGAAAPPPARGRGPAAPAGLGSAMQDMDRVLKILKADAADPTKLDQSLRNVAILQRDVLISKLGTPPVVNRMAAGDKKVEETENYRKAMNGLLHVFLDLEEAIADKKPDDIKKAFEQLDQMEKVGHEEFRPERG